MNIAFECYPTNISLVLLVEHNVCSLINNHQILHECGLFLLQMAQKAINKQVSLIIAHQHLYIY